jgi:hypothetical protein
MSWQSCPVQAHPSKKNCQAHLSRLTCPGSPVRLSSLPVLSACPLCLSCPPVLSNLSCLSCPAPSLLYPAHLSPTVWSLLSWPGIPSYLS